MQLQPPTRQKDSPTDAMNDAVLRGVDAVALTEALGRRSLVAEDKIHLISIEAVREALGSRWPARRAQVCETVQLQFRKYLAPSDTCVAVDDALFLIATPGVNANTGQGLCFRGLKEVLTYFLGEVRPSAVKVHLVSSVAGGVVVGRQLPVSELEVAETQAFEPPPPRQAPPPAAEETWPLTAIGGRDLRVSCVLDPIISVSLWGLAGYRLSGRIVDAETGKPIEAQDRRRLLPRDFIAVDLGTFARAESRLAGRRPDEAPLLVIQISFAVLSSLSARSTIVTRLTGMKAAARRRVIIEVADMEGGLPSGRLAEVVAVLNPLCKGVWAQIQPIAEAITNAETARVAGVAVRAEDFGDTPEQLASGLARFGTLTTGRFRAVSVIGLPARTSMLDAAKAGFGYVSLQPK